MRFLLSALFVSFLFFGTECRPKHARANSIEDVHLRFYNGSSVEEYVNINLPNARTLLEQDGFERNNATVLYAHGYLETPDSESVQVVIQAHLDTNPGANVVLIDWSNMAGMPYTLNAAPNTKVVGQAVSRELSVLVEGGLNVAGIHLVGHSLGAHVVGIAGKFLQSYNVKLQRITGLDPADKLFYPGFLLDHISDGDAEYVDIIHTDAGGYGAFFSTGTADFWPNGGTPIQPGCPRIAPIPLSPDNLCSHWRSWRFWSEILRNPSSFPSVPFKSYSQFKKESATNKKPINYMGIDADPRKSGSFYLQTNNRVPFGRGIAGTVYQ